MPSSEAFDNLSQQGNLSDTRGNGTSLSADLAESSRKSTELTPGPAKLEQQLRSVEDPTGLPDATPHLDETQETTTAISQSSAETEETLNTIQESEGSTQATDDASQTDNLTTLTGPITTTLTPTTEVPSAENGTNFTKTINVTEPRDSSLNCICDLLVGTCDINCCCDPECSEEDRQVFSHCTPTSGPVSLEYCMSRKILALNNTRYKLQRSNNLFCIARDHGPPPLVPHLVQPAATTAEELERLKPPHVYTWSSYRPRPLTPTAKPSIQAGDKMAVSYDDGLTLQLWKFPGKMFNGHCERQGQEMVYLEDWKGRCLQMVAQDCGPDLDVRTYLAGLVVSGAPLTLNESVSNSTSNATEEEVPENNWCLNYSCVPLNLTSMTLWEDANLYSATSNLSAPQWDEETSSCINVTRKLRMVVFHDGKNGVTSVQVDAELVRVNLRVDKLNNTVPNFFHQEFSVEFAWKDSHLPLRKRSGNPGYLLGFPIPAGNVVVVESEPGLSQAAIRLETEPSYWLTVLPATGMCSTAALQTPVGFGENTRSGCLMAVDSDALHSCQRLQAQVFALLRGPQPPTHAAKFGDASILRLEDWVEMEEGEIPAPSPSSDGVCSALVLSMHTAVLFRRMGPSSAPQNVIAEVRRTYGPPQEIPPFAPVVIELSTSVTFMDLSLPPKSLYAPLPQIDFHLPFDFFYPFYFHSSFNDSLSAATLCLNTPSIVFLAVFFTLFHPF